MLKNSKSKTYIVLLLSMLLVLAPVLTATSSDAGNAAQVQDNELVVSALNDAGNIESIQVLSHVRVSGGGTITVQDQSKYKLESVRNLYGSEKIAQNGNSLGMNFKLGSGDAYKDLYYLAKLDKSEVSKVSMPVSVKVSYYLNDKKVEASKIAGKDGHLKIVCEMENLTGAKKMLEFKNNKGETVKTESLVYTPYVVSLSGWEFDNNKFSNIQAPGVSQKSPEGVVVDVQGKTSVSWTVPLIPPSYPAQQYTVLEADGKDIDLPSYKIAVIPIVPTTSAIDNLGTVQESFGKLYDAFDSIQNGVGTASKNATLLNGLSQINGGLDTVSGGIGKLITNLKTIRVGVSNPSFESASYDSAKGTDAKGNKPGVREAVTLSKSALDTKVVAALEGQKKVLTVMEATMGKPGGEAVQPSLSTTLYNDVSFLQGLVKGTPAEAVLTKAMGPKIIAMGANLGVLRDGGNLITAGGSIPFPASVSTVQSGIEQISAGLGKASNGAGMIAMGLGNLDANGNPNKVMVNGQPGSILYAMVLMKEGIDGKMLPGVEKLMAGTSKIASGSGQAKDAISGGINKLAAAPAIVSALEDNVALNDSFLGKPEGAKGSVVYVYQTPEVSAAAAGMKYGLFAIVLALIALFAIGRPKSAAQFAEVNKEM